MANNIINKKLFGSDIPDSVKKTLEERQLIAKEPQPGESVDHLKKVQTYNDGTNYGIGGMSSKTPFVRMWVALESIIKQPTDKTWNLQDNTIEQAKNIEGDGKFDESGTREVIEFGKVYKLTKSKDFNIFELGNSALYDLMDSSNNPFLRPEAGITGCTSYTSGTFGIIKTTEVNFKVFNVQDYQDIYQRYFLKPGALIFVDFGWNTIRGDGDTFSLYSPQNDIFSGNGTTGIDVNKFLYGDVENDESGWIDKQKGNVETVWGRVVNYDSKMNPDGSFDCKVEIKSSNMSMNGSVQKNINIWVSEKIEKLVDTYLVQTGKKIPEGLYDAITVGHGDAIMPWKNSKYTSKIDLDKLEEIFETLSDDQMFVPLDEELQWGIMIKDDYAWMSLDLLETMILNPLFTFSESMREGTRNPNDSEVRFDSTFGLTYAGSDNIMKQMDASIYSHSPDDLPILFPGQYLDPHWRSSGLSFDEAWGVRKTLPSKTDKMGTLDLFIRVDLIEKAFSDTDPKSEGFNLVHVVKSLLKDINESEPYMDLQLIRPPHSDNQFMVHDMNVLGSSTYIDGTPQTKEDYEKLFVFDITTPKSLVSEVNLSFTMPSDNLANMIAISGNSQARGFSALNRLDDEALCLELAHSFLDANIVNNVTEITDYYTSYKPTLETDDSFLFKQRAFKANYQSRLDEVFDRSLRDITEIRSIDRKKISKERIKNKIKSLVDEVQTITINTPETTDANDGTLTPEEIVVQERLQEYMEKEGSSVSYGAVEYWNKRLSDIHFNDFISTPLPLKLSMTINGISSLEYGNVFRVNYLPKSFKNKIYFQITKVEHHVSSGNWKTKLETQFRFRVDVKQKSSKIQKYLNHYISSAFIRKFVTDHPSTIRIPFENLFKVSTLFGTVGGPNKHASLFPKPLLSFEGRFDIDDADVKGYECDGNGKVKLPNKILDVLDNDIIEKGRDLDNTEMETSVFLYAKGFIKGIKYSGKETSKAYLGSDIARKLGQFDNFLVEDVDMNSSGRFLLARDTDASGIYVWQHNLYGTGGTKMQNAAWNSQGFGISSPQQVVAFYPGIPNREKQLCMCLNGRMIWIPWKQFTDIKGKSGKVDIINCMEIFLEDSSKGGAGSFFRIFDNIKGQQKFISAGGGGYTKDVEMNIIKGDQIVPWDPGTMIIK